MVANPEQSQEYAKKYGQMMAKVWSDPAFKQRLMTDPRAVLQEQGIEVPAGLEVRPLQQSQQMIYFPIPAAPSGEISDEQLEQVAGGSTASTAGSAGSVSTVCGFTVSTIGSAGCAGTAG